MKYVFRCSADSGAYEYLILSYIEGKDIGLIYSQLQDEDKKEFAKEIVQIQNQVALG